jgi:hypothetical protein
MEKPSWVIKRGSGLGGIKSKHYTSKGLFLIITALSFSSTINPYSVSF